MRMRTRKTLLTLLACAGLAALLAIDPALWRKEISDFREYLGKYGSHLPAALLQELQVTEARLG